MEKNSSDRESAKRKTPWDDIESQKWEPPTTSPDMACGIYLREIKRRGKMEDIANFLDDVWLRKYENFETPEELQEATKDYQEAVSQSLNEEDKNQLQYYTSWTHRYINQVMRGYWSYEYLGPRTPEREDDARETARKMDAAIEKAPAIGADIETYRGTTIDNFRGYNIETLADLKSLRGQFYLETGFTSSSMVQSESFAAKTKENPDLPQCNVEITYCVPKESDEGIALLSDDLSFKTNECEYLMRSGTLFYVISSEVDEEQNTAKMIMVVIPRDLYDSRPDAEA